MSVCRLSLGEPLNGTDAVNCRDDGFAAAAVKPLSEADVWYFAPQIVPEATRGRAVKGQKYKSEKYKEFGGPALQLQVTLSACTSQT